jgi:hypothetical protein
MLICVCLRILASSRIPRYDLGRQNPSFLRWFCYRRGRAGGWVDEDRDLYRRHGSPSPDRYHDHHGIQAVVRDVGPSGG